MTIRRLAPQNCPRCTAPASMYVASDQRITCRICGFKLIDALNDVAEAEATPSAPPPRPHKPLKERYAVTYQLLHSGQVDTWTRSMYDTAIDYVRQDKHAEAVRAFKRVLEQQNDLLDAHLWLARLSDDPQEKHKHYSEVVAQMPNHLESIRELMVLKGDLSRAEADRSWHADAPNVVKLDMPAEAEAITLDCPVCGGKMGKGQDGRAKCLYCGYQEAQQGYAGGYQSLTMAILKRRGQAIQWEVGERLLRCTSCGAERLLLPQTLKSSCPFCGSAHVLERDAVQSFVRPDVILPFTISEAQARESLQGALNSPLERVAGLFSERRVRSKTLLGVYVCLWLFDVTVRVTRVSNDPYAQFASRQHRHLLSNRREEFGDTVFDFPSLGASSPNPRAVERLGGFDVRRAIPYDPKHLAGYEAELYDVDFEKASVAVRRRVGEAIRARYNHNPHGESPVNVSSSVQTMQFRLALVPLWVATLEEVDGDTRVGLVHGQSGRATLERAVRT